VKLKVAWIGKSKESHFQCLAEEYLKRIGRYAEIEGVALKQEAALLELSRKPSGPRHTLVVLDERGRQLSSQGWAAFLRDCQDRHRSPLLFAIGSANGFSRQTVEAADHVLSFGPMTVAHELARVMLLEQLYRAFTILKGHPYHSGH
jgi:23S rRNA (pseudouridine1915-N3)-methyltransferase